MKILYLDKDENREKDLREHLSIKGLIIERLKMSLKQFVLCSPVDTILLSQISS